MKKSLLILLFALGVSYWGLGQTTIFTESMGTVSATTTIIAHETANGFDNDGYTMTSGGAAMPADIRQTSVSSGYTGASGLANVFFTSTNNSYGFAIEGIDASTYTTLKIQFGYRKESGTVLPTLAFDYWDGSVYVNVPFTFNEAANAAVGWYLSPQISLPLGAQISSLKIKWVKSGTASVRIDDVKLIGTAATLTPTIIVGTVSPFGNQTINTISVEQNYSVSGSNLTNDIIIQPPVGFEISITSGSGFIANPSTLTLTQSGGSVNSTTIFVRFAPINSGPYAGNITHASTGASSQNVAVSGTGVCDAASFPFYEDFNFNASLLTSHCWASHSGGGTNSIAIATSSISYPGYLSSGIGNAVTLTASGEDDNRSFTAQTSGSIYASFLVNVTFAPVAGDYFFHLGQTTIGSIFRGRVFVKDDGTGNIAFGISQSTTTANYSAFSYALNTTYLIVLRFDIASGLTNDIASIYINPALNAVEPASGWLTNTDAAGTDLTEVGSVALRQGSNTPVLTLDGIRISSNWADIVGLIPPSTSTWNGSISNDWHNSNNWSDGVPGGITNVTIPAGLINYPTLSTTGACNNIFLGSTLAGTASLLDNGNLTINGTANVERYLTNNEWHYISAPVDNPTAGVFLGMYMMEWDEPTGAWTYITDENYVMSTDMEGFAVWTYNPGTAVYSGNLNTGAKSISMTNTVAALHDNKGFNFTGNPYPSAVDWNISGGWTKTNLDNSIYIWIQQTINGGQYGSYNGVVGTFDVTNIIPSQQGFFVHVSDGNATGSLGVNNNARIHSSTDIFKSTVSIDDILKLRVAGNNYSDEMIILIDPETSVNADQWDATKLYGSEAAPQLFSLSKDNQELSINSFPVQDDYMVIPVGLEVGADAVYAISVTDFAGFEFSSGIYLEDLKEGTFIQLNGNATYSFTANLLDEPMRFLLHLNSELAVPENISDLNDVKVYSFNQDVYISSENILNGVTTIYDIMGREIISQNLNGVTMTKVNLQDHKGYFIVNVITENGMLNHKVYIR